MRKMLVQIDNGYFNFFVSQLNAWFCRSKKKSKLKQTVNFELLFHKFENSTLKKKEKKVTVKGVQDFELVSNCQLVF